MKADVRRRIEQALARTRGEPVNSPIPDLKEAVEQAMSGEREYSIDEIAQRHGLTYHTVYRAVKGKTGYRIYGTKRGARVTESLYRSFLADSIRRGLAA
jgi:hypothetical protein